MIFQSHHHPVDCGHLVCASAVTGHVLKNPSLAFSDTEVDVAVMVQESCDTGSPRIISDFSCELLVFFLGLLDGAREETQYGAHREGNAGFACARAKCA